MSQKVILVLSDALRYDTAVASMGYLGHLVEAKKASLYKVKGEVPSMSRPMYETVHTGLTSSEHGIVSNLIVRRSNQPNVFRAARDAGRTTAAVAYYFVSELYNRAPFDPLEDGEVDDDSLTIQHGRFYTQDEFPDPEVFHIAGRLVRRFEPDYLLIHPMGMDHTGETYGADSSEYRNHAIMQDKWLAGLLVEWLEKNYIVLVTGDHGINADRAHGGTLPEVRDVPLFVMRPDQAGLGDTGQTLSQLQVAPTVCALLGIPTPETMRHPPIA